MAPEMRKRLSTRLLIWAAVITLMLILLSTAAGFADLQNRIRRELQRQPQHGNISQQYQPAEGLFVGERC